MRLDQNMTAQSPDALIGYKSVENRLKNIARSTNLITESELFIFIHSILTEFSQRRKREVYLEIHELII